MVEMSELLALCVEKQASDLHLSAAMPPMVRIQGKLCRLDYPELSAETVARLLDSVMDEVQQRDYRLHLETDFALELPDCRRFRVNAFTATRGPAAVFRHIPDKIPSLDEINAPAALRHAADYPNGLVLLTGPTGSGKSTTLAALIDHINTHRPAHILTIEDPIEFVHRSKQSLINQRELHRHTQSFHHALRSALREDPDVILIGEMRDAETIRLALTAAETGHLVFSTLHTGSAAKAVDRIIDVFPAGEKEAVRTMLAESLQAVVAQTLLPTRQGRRIAAHEILTATPAVRNLIREHKTAQLYSAMQTGQAHGMQTMEQAQNLLVRQGVIAAPQPVW
ncbi:type IV pilus twitching motility protein PilT [Neisseria lisongii]|uniref:Type IV pilus twitching motility protein PilT n=1 Tax=Neisseria lisongii TaxID=2912188 RepID=A0AAW5AQ93_9NEIS|nr:type IV pilus twitching motility protein PilT [Neisseria lisongii]MCF7530586.1 type IV pilus twitching motility protein PilT [Neisseria lisongii]